MKKRRIDKGSDSKVRLIISPEDIFIQFRGNYRLFNQITAAVDMVNKNQKRIITNDMFVRTAIIEQCSKVFKGFDRRKRSGKLISIKRKKVA